MFIISLHYLRDLSEIDRFIPEHRDFLERHYASGHFLMSGRKNPRTGGIIVAQAGSLAEIEAILRQDPFHREQLARYEVTEFQPTLTQDALAHYRVD